MIFFFFEKKGLSPKSERITFHRDNIFISFVYHPRDNWLDIWFNIRDYPDSKALVLSPVMELVLTGDLDEYVTQSKQENCESEITHTNGRKQCLDYEISLLKKPGFITSLMSIDKSFVDKYYNEIYQNQDLARSELKKHDIVWG